MIEKGSMLQEGGLWEEGGGMKMREEGGGRKTDKTKCYNMCIKCNCESCYLHAN